jgi:hypothetical protein
MKNVSTGAGLCVLGLCIVGYPLVDRIGTRAEAGIPAAGAVAAAALAQDPPAPTIVWYGVCPPGLASGYNTTGVLFRAWSNGRIEYKTFWPPVGQNVASCELWLGPSTTGPCGWRVFSDPSAGLTFNADLNFDEAVDGVDLGELLAKWGPAPRNPVPPSDCPLALINP